MNILRKTRQNKQKKSYKMPFARRGLAVFMSGLLLFLYIVPVEAGQIVSDENQTAVTDSLVDETEADGEGGGVRRKYRTRGKAGIFGK